MYAAAGGASLASRQARQRQRQQDKTKALEQQAKLAKAKTSGTVTPTRVQQSRQFHQLPSTYLRTPQAQARKLSANFATQSKLLLPICEGNNHQQGQHVQLPHHQIPHSHSQYHQVTGQHDPHTTPKFGRYDRFHQHLTKSATATLPLVSQADDATPAATPLAASHAKAHFGDSRSSDPNQSTHIQLPIPHDSIIVTPATPLASPGHTAVAAAAAAAAVAAATGVDPSIAPSGQLERKCSFYRVRRSDAFEIDGSNYTATGPGGTITAHQVDYTDENNLIYGLPNGGSGKWAEAVYCEQGICSCDHIECAQGRAAWLERGRRCSVQDNNPASCHRRWVKRNRIQDSSLGGSSDDEDFLGVLRGPSSFANAFLYVGLGTIAIGLVIAFVGTGEKGFKTVELRLIGPSLIGIGFICCVLRICFCICPSHCLSSRRARKKNSNKIDADHTTSLLRGESKRVSIAKGPHLQRFPLTHKSKSNSKMLNEGMEALRQIATTSLFLQNEQKTLSNRVVPIIKEPEKPTEAPLEMKKLETTLNICDISDDDDDEEEAAAASFTNNQTESLVQSQGKLAKQRLPTNQQKGKDSDLTLMETSLMVLNTSTPPPTSSASVTNSTIAAQQSSKASTSRHHHPGQAFEIPSSSGSGAVGSGTSHNTLQLPMSPTSPPSNSNYSACASINTMPSTSSHHHQHQQIALPSTSASTVEPELVLSPAKLGQ